MKSVVRNTVVVLLATFSLIACETVRTTQSGAVGIDRQQRMSVSAQAMEQSASKQYAQLMAEARKKDKLNANPEQ